MYGLQMLHLTPNAVMTLSVFAHFCEMFVGVRPSVDLFHRFFVAKHMNGPACRVRLLYAPSYTIFLDILKEEKWEE